MLISNFKIFKHFDQIFNKLSQFSVISKTQYFQFGLARNRSMVARLDSILKTREYLGSGCCHNYKIGPRLLKNFSNSMYSFFYLFLINLGFLKFFQKSIYSSLFFLKSRFSVHFLKPILPGNPDPQTPLTSFSKPMSLRNDEGWAKVLNALKAISQK